MGVVGDWFREAVKWDVYQLERGSGWVQKLFDEMPDWLRLPFVTIYGISNPSCPQSSSSLPRSPGVSPASPAHWAGIYSGHCYSMLLSQL